MDETVVALVAAGITGLVTGATGEAGKAAWMSLTTMVKKAFGKKDEQQTALELVEAVRTDGRDVTELSEVLVERAGWDTQFASELSAWLENIKALPKSDGPTNVVAGSAQVTGPLIQGRDFSGPISFGTPPPSGGKP
ncbi:hypothetical protein ITP53_43280 [Nonomuraea sp. K274]|uniref:Uncharacterized protein n=1 Tax=Nonomuraea cypriaca TaxID=1187855 RepID=A0A931AGG5_9ACTN|nr:hypothetical protein [Nonomuraea cypriaca]MBF8192391.1 hypothetical protein [Nonomuraea cypriaca]